MDQNKQVRCYLSFQLGSGRPADPFREGAMAFAGEPVMFVPGAQEPDTPATASFEQRVQEIELPPGIKDGKGSSQKEPVDLDPKKEDEESTTPKAGEEDLKYIIVALKIEIKEMKERMDAMIGKTEETKNDDKYDKSRLKPVDVKDIKKPEEYDGDTKQFAEWFERIKELLQNRHESWSQVIRKIEEFKTEKIIDSKKQIFDKFKDHEKYKGICEQEETYTQQLATYLRAYTKGMLHERIVKTPVEDICEMLRDIIQKAKTGTKRK